MQRAQPAGHRIRPATVHIEFHRRVARDGGQALAHFGAFAPLDQSLLQLAFFLLCAFRQRVFQRAIAGNEPDGGFFANAGDAGQIVARVAHQALDIDQAFRRNAIGFLDIFGRHAHDVRRAAARIQDGNALARELKRVPVSGHEHANVARLGNAAGNGAEHIVGLITVHRKNGHAHGLQNFAQDGKLHAQILGRGRAARLIIGVLRVPERRPVRIEGHGKVFRLLVAQRAQQHGKKAEYRVGGRSIGIHGGQRVKRAVRDAVAIQQNQLPVHPGGFLL